MGAYRDARSSRRVASKESTAPLERATFFESTVPRERVDLYARAVTCERVVIRESTFDRDRADRDERDRCQRASRSRRFCIAASERANRAERDRCRRASREMGAHRAMPNEPKDNERRNVDRERVASPECTRRDRTTERAQGNDSNVDVERAASCEPQPQIMRAPRHSSESKPAREPMLGSETRRTRRVADCASVPYEQNET